MENEKYNGYSNYDTWLVMLWLNNEEQNYRKLCNLVKGIGVSKKIKDLTETEMYDTLKTFHYGDKVDWNLVNVLELQELIVEDFEE